MNALQVYAQLRDVCHALDKLGEHAAAAYASHGMALLERKYDIDPDRIDDIIALAPRMDVHSLQG